MTEAKIETDEEPPESSVRHEFIPMEQDNTYCARYGCALGAAADVHDVESKNSTFLGVGGELWNFIHTVRNTLVSGKCENTALAARATEMLAKVGAMNICTCQASPSQEHATYCPREGMDYDAHTK